MKLVSACLVGINCNYKGGNRLNQKLLEEFRKGELLPVCPEIFGWQSIPRKDAEIKGGTGIDVLRSCAMVIEPDGKDVSKHFVSGAEIILRIAKALDIKEAILKSRSPSCGSGRIYDGSFSKNLIDGDGVTAALLKKNGVKVYTEEDFM